MVEEGFHMSNLVELDLSFSNLRGYERLLTGALRGCGKHLNTLSLRSTNVRSHVSHALSDLPLSSSLQRLDVANNKSFKAPHVLVLLQNLSSLKRLVVSSALHEQIQQLSQATPSSSNLSTTTAPLSLPPSEIAVATSSINASSLFSPWTQYQGIITSTPM